MGFAITWCGFRASHTDDLLKQLDLTRTGEMEEVPESPVTLARLSTGWNVLWYNRQSACPFLSSEKIPELSTTRELILCSVEEHIMFSSSELWVDGEQHWTISHDGSSDPGGLRTFGKMPACFLDLKQEMELQQMAADRAEEGVDYIFEIPLLVAKELIGFKHDESDDTFMVLKENRPEKILRFPFNIFSKWLGSS